MECYPVPAPCLPYLHVQRGNNRERIHPFFIVKNEQSSPSPILPSPASCCWYYIAQYQNPIPGQRPGHSENYWRRILLFLPPIHLNSPNPPAPLLLFCFHYTTSTTLSKLIPLLLFAPTASLPVNQPTTKSSTYSLSSQLGLLNLQNCSSPFYHFCSNYIASMLPPTTKKGKQQYPCHEI